MPIVNVPVVAPAETVTVAGTGTFDQLVDKLTIVPAARAGPVRVTVPVEVDPPVTDVGETEILANCGNGLIVSIASSETPL